jgi:hypothetical protein
MQITGTIKRITPTVVVSEKFRKREVVVVTNEQYPQELGVQFTQNKCEMLENYAAGQEVVIDINLRGRDYTNRNGEVVNATNIEGWKIEKLAF